MTTETITSYKGFDKDLKCRGFQYEIGKEYEIEGVIEVCERGFHACENPLDVLKYYPPTTSRYCIVEQSGELSYSNEDGKVASSKIRIVHEISLEEFIYIARKLQSKSNELSSVNSDDCTISNNSGYGSISSNSGDFSISRGSSNNSVSTNTGCRSISNCSGYNSMSHNSGYHSLSNNCGDFSVSLNNGHFSSARVEGVESIAIVAGRESKASGSLGCWLVLVERDKNNYIKNIISVKVDGEKIKENTYYGLVDGEVKEF